MDTLEQVLDSRQLRTRVREQASLNAVAERFGGKCAGLARLAATRPQIAVPEWIALDEEAIGAVLNPADPSRGELREKILGLMEELASPAAASKLALKNPAGIKAKASKPGAQLDASQWIPLAVRSSVVGEDGTEHSFAGQFLSVLDVRGPEAVLEAVKKVFASFDTAGVHEYLKARHLAPGSLKPAILIQRMVPARAAGIAFTRTDGALVESISGLGDALAAGLESGDSWELDRRGQVKSLSVASGPPSLSPRDLRELARALDTLRRDSGRDVDGSTPRHANTRELDVEFAFGPAHQPTGGDSASWGRARYRGRNSSRNRGRLYILQVRPQTAPPAAKSAPEATGPAEGTVNQPAKQQGQATGNHRIWDNSNIVESYSGITLPLTFSFIRVAYRAVYRQFCELAGIPRATIAAHDSLFSNMLGIFGGRVYYNLLNWYRLLSLLPGYAFNRRAMEEMMGVGSSLEEQDDNSAGTAKGTGTAKGAGPAAKSRPASKIRENPLARIFIHGPALLRTVLRLVGLWFGSGRRMDRFIRDFNARYQVYNTLDFDGMDERALLALRRELEGEILARWKAPIVNDLVAMVAMGVLTRLLKPCGSDPNALLVNSGGIPSAAIAQGLEELAALIAQDEACSRAFLAADSPTRERLVDSAPPESGIREHWQSWLAHNGARGVEEMKLESRPIGEDPGLCLHLVAELVKEIQADTDAPPPAPSSSDGPAPATGGPQGRRHAAAPRQAGATKAAPPRNDPPDGLRLKPAPLRRALIRYFLERTRQAIRDRERQRFCRAEAYSLMRRLFAALGRRWARDGVLDEARDIFWLEWDEIGRAIEGAQDLVAFRELVALRKASRETSSGTPLPDRFETYGVPAFSPLPTRPAGTATDKLAGTGASPGTVEGRILKLETPDSTRELSGRIVLARQTDPGWIVIFPAIAALIVEKGSILSHSAIVARELGLPCIVGARGAFDRIPDGALVRMDASTGRIQILEED